MTVTVLEVNGHGDRDSDSDSESDEEAVRPGSGRQKPSGRVKGPDFMDSDVTSGGIRVAQPAAVTVACAGRRHTSHRRRHCYRHTGPPKGTATGGPRRTAAARPEASGPGSVP